MYLQAAKLCYEHLDMASVLYMYICNVTSHLGDTPTGRQKSDRQQTRALMSSSCPDIFDPDGLSFMLLHTVCDMHKWCIISIKANEDF